MTIKPRDLEIYSNKEDTIYFFNVFYNSKQEY
jgi:hypothetical protein